MKDYIVIEESAFGSFRTQPVKHVEVHVRGWDNAKRTMKDIALMAHLEGRNGIVYIRSVYPNGVNPIVKRGGMFSISNYSSISDPPAGRGQQNRVVSEANQSVGLE